MYDCLVGKHSRVVTEGPGWVSFCGPDHDEREHCGLFAPPRPNADGNYDLIYVAWDEDGIIREAGLKKEE
jgi:hypothetical protein